MVSALAATLAGLVCAAAPASGQAARRVNIADILPAMRTDDNAAAGGMAPPPLVHVDEELGSYLAQAQRLIEQGKHDQAIQILQALIQREESGFYAEGGNRFVSMRLKANELLGRMGEKGLKLYRALYDPQAHQLYSEALASARPEALLRKLSERYLHTSYGPKSLETLGALYFDRASFSRAATCWHRLLTLTGQDAQRATMLAKIAAAHHLAGEPAAADRAAAELRKKYPDTSAVLGGRTQRLVDFVARVWKLPPSPAGRGPKQPGSGWPGLGGVPDGMATMSDCDVVLTPQWRVASDDIDQGGDLLSKLLAGASMYLTSTRYSGSSGRSVRRVVGLRKGHLCLRSSVSGGDSGDVLLPGILHPVVAGEQVILRLEDKIAAYDLLTGEFRWDSFVSLPMVRRIAPTGGAYVHHFGAFQYIGDNGYHTLTVGGGRIYTVCDFLPASGNLAYIQRRNQGLANLDDGSVLAALSVVNEGRLEWRIGRGRGSHEVVRNGRFLSAPTYRAERLYVLVLYLERYHLVCLDADSGSLIWHVPIAQAPALVRRYGNYLGTDPRLAVGSAPAVSDGRIYVTTNSGVVAAFEEETGEPLWGYQYAGRMNAIAQLTPRGIFGAYHAAGYPPANPVIVAGSRVICLPADSQNLLALDAATGEVRWSKSRRNQSDLSAIDRDRVLLSGRGLFVLRVSDGEGLGGGEEDIGVNGRPAVSSRRVFASAEGKIEVMDLKTYQRSTVPLAAADGFLGNLVCADGKLVAASMLGICTYFGYDVARAELTRRVDRALPADRPALLRQRAQLAFDARRFDSALADLKACEAAARARNDMDTASQLPQRFYRTYVALGNHAASDGAMHEMFLKALSHAATDQDKAHMQLRLAKYHEKAGAHAKAVELAQQIAEEYADQELADVQIGPGAGDSVQFGRREPMFPAGKLAGDYIRGLLSRHGRECYVKFDALAKKALDAALAAGDPAAMLAVAERWPNSQWRDDALFRASEAYYVMAAGDPKKADDCLAEARRHLYGVARMDDSPLRFSASVALAMIYAHGGWVTSARKECEGLRELPGETQVAFADVKGRLSDVLELIEGGKLPRSPQRMKLIARISPPLAELFSIEGKGIWLLRDQEYRPVRLGGKLAVVRGPDAYLLDTASRGAEEAMSAWKGLVGVDTDEVHKYSHYPPGMRLIGGLSRDGKALVVADRKTIRGLDLVSAKVLWQRQMAEIGVQSFHSMGVGCGVLVVACRTGKVSCLDIARGELLWQNDLVGGTRYPVAPPRIAGQLVVLRHDGGKTVTCLGLARGGRVVGRWQASQWTECELSEDGLLVMMIDGELTVREAAKIDKPLWRCKYDPGRQPTMLGASSDMIAVSPSSASGPVEVMSMGGGRKVATLDVAAVAGMPGVPFDARFVGRDVYVLCAAGLSGRRRSVYGRLTNSRGIALQKFSLPDGKRQWSCELEKNPSVYFPGVLPPVFGKEHAIVTARHYQTNMAYHAHVVRLDTGQVVQKIDLQGKGAGPKDENRRRQGIGQPVMTNGRLCVETSEGVKIYGER
ncbi:MAG: PQQ-binding-like beta-propeller repeat protein [Phycisphaerae bacterium]